MPIASGYNNPVIGQAMSNIAQLFAPPSTGELIASQQLQMQKDAAAARAGAVSTLAKTYGAVPGLAAGLGAGLDVAQLGKLLQLNTAASNPNNLSAQDAVNYANTGTVVGTITGKNLDPLSSDQVRYVSGQATGGAPSAQYGVLKNGDQTTLLPNGRLPTLAAAAPTDASDGDTAAAASGPTLGPGGVVTIAGPNKPDKMPSTDQVIAGWLQRQPKETQDAIMSKRAAQGTGTSINIGGAEGAAEKAFGEAVGGDIANTVNQAGAAPQALAEIAQMRAAAKAGAGNLTTGPLGPYVLKGKQALGGLLGVQLPGTSEAEVINNIGYGLATQAARAISNRPTQFEFSQALATKPGLSLSPQGMDAILNIKEQDLRDQQNLAQLAQDPKNRTNWQAVKAAYYAAHPVMSPFDPSKPLGQADVDTLNAAAAAPAPAANPGTGRSMGAQAPVAVRSAADYAALPSGAQFMAPDGKLRVKP